MDATGRRFEMTPWVSEWPPIGVLPIGGHHSQAYGLPAAMSYWR